MLVSTYNVNQIDVFLYLQHGDSGAVFTNDFHADHIESIPGKDSSSRSVRYNNPTWMYM